jgi:hypothetical protein
VRQQEDPKAFRVWPWNQLQQFASFIRFRQSRMYWNHSLHDLEVGLNDTTFLRVHKRRMFMCSSSSRPATIRIWVDWCPLLEEHRALTLIICSRNLSACPTSSSSYPYQMLVLTYQNLPVADGPRIGVSTDTSFSRPWLTRFGRCRNRAPPYAGDTSFEGYRSCHSDSEARFRLQSGKAYVYELWTASRTKPGVALAEALTMKQELCARSLILPILNFGAQSLDGAFSAMLSQYQSFEELPPFLMARTKYFLGSQADDNQ